MKNWMVFLIGLSCISLVPLAAQIPVIISQPTSVSASEGDSVTIEVIAEGNCRLQWFTAQNKGEGYFNYQEIPGQNFYRLTLNPAHASSVPWEYYLLRLASLTDTIWSAGIKVLISELRKPFEDTVFINHVPGYARFFDGFCVTNQHMIWSSGDTTYFPSGKTYARFTNYGKNWVTTVAQGYSRTDTFIVAECPHILHIDSVTPLPKCWCADTIYIDRDVRPGVIQIASGTTIKFTGDYELSSGYMDARAVEGDSIVFEGYIDPITQKYKGWLYSHNLSPNGENRPTSFACAIIKHMDQIDLFRNGSATFYRNNKISYFDASGVFFQNKRIELMHAAGSSIFLENDSVFGITIPHPKGVFDVFYFGGNIFENNKSGLVIKGGGWVHINNNIFRNNPATLISSHAIYNYLDNNLFIQNFPGENNLMKFTNYLAFRNNTLFNNKGTGVLLYENSWSSNVGGDIMNNIFYNAPGRVAINVTAAVTGLKINHNSFSGDSTSIVAPADTAIDIFSNLFSTYPEFTDTLMSDFTLKEHSPLIDKGSDIVHGPVINDFYYTRDFKGFPRKTGLAIDPGAYEYRMLTPLAFKYISPDTIVCNRDTITLKAIPEGCANEDNIIITWYRNGSRYSESNSPYLVIDGSRFNVEAVYEAEMTNGVDTIRTGPIHLSVLQKPDLSSQSAYQLVCTGKDLSLKVTKPQVKTNYWWTSANYGPYNEPTIALNIPNVVESDTLTITAVNACSSAQSAPIILKIAPLPAPSLGADTTLHAGDSLLLDAGEGVRYAWRSGETGAQIYGYPNDTAWVTVTNAYGCTGSDTLVISMIPSGLDQPGARGLEFLLYPNPARDRIFIRIPEEMELPCRLQLVALNGAVVLETVLREKGLNECDLTSLEKGTYTITLFSGSSKGIGKLIIR